MGTILVVGSGLTALDVIAAFRKARHTNPVCVLSRRGRYPMAHVTRQEAPVDPIPAGMRPRTVREIVACVRAALREAAAHGRDWRPVIDGLRPEIQRLWLGFDLAERRRFFRHVRGLYDPHRHRAPQAQIENKDALVRRGQLTTVAGRLVSLRAVPGALEATIVPRGTSDARLIPAAQIINCGGPGNDYAAGAESLVANLLRRGDITVDPTALGLSALADGRLLDAQGLPNIDLYTIGWSMRGVLLESTAVRELRGQARLLATTLVGSASISAEYSTINA